jgi:protein ImuB
MLWLALHLPHLSLEAFCASLPGEPAAAGRLATDTPVALVAEHRITEFNAAAAALGLRVGMKRATSLALAADLLLGEADRARDAAALRAVAHAALAFTPAVTM